MLDRGLLLRFVHFGEVSHVLYKSAHLLAILSFRDEVFAFYFFLHDLRVRDLREMFTDFRKTMFESDMKLMNSPMILPQCKIMRLFVVLKPW